MLALVQDEPRDTDEQVHINGLLYIVDKTLLETVKPIQIDFTPMGFFVTGNLDAAGSVGSCGTCR